MYIGELNSLTLKPAHSFANNKIMHSYLHTHASRGVLATSQSIHTLYAQ